MTRLFNLVFWILLAAFCAAYPVCAQTTEFVFQGSLKDGASSANGNYDFQFALYDALSGGNQIGSTLTQNTVAVSNGSFSVKLDFGSQFPGANRFLEIRVRLTGQPSLTTLTPRQLVNSAPYSVKSLNTDNATTATNATQLGGVAASQYVVTTDPRMTDSRTPTAGSTNYIQNQNASPQSSSNFNISGTGTANIFNAATQFSLNGNRVLSTDGTSNLFVGIGAGTNNTGLANAFVGTGAGQANTSGVTNSFFGTSAGGANTLGGGNSFFGTSAGSANQAGNNNAFFGVAAGTANTASLNAFFGSGAGQSNTSGGANSFFGTNAGFANTIGVSNTAIGSAANLGSGNLQYATAIGADSTVATSNTIALGRSNGSDQVVIPGNLVVSGSFTFPPGNPNYIQNTATLQASSNFNISGNGFVGGNLGVGTTNPQSKIEAFTATNNFGFNHTDGTTTVGTFVSASAGSVGTRSNHPLTFFTNSGGSQMTLLTNGNVGIGTFTPQSKLEAFTATNNYGFSHTDGTTRISSFVGAGSFGTTGGWFGTTSNHPLFFYTNNGIPRMAISTGGNVGIGTTNPTSTLDVSGNVSASSFSGSGISSASNLFLNASSGGRIALRTSGSIERMTILDNGNVGIHNQVPSSIFDVNNGKLSVDDIGVKVDISQTIISPAHVCYENARGYLTGCQSAAEHVPSIDNGAGFPETADLVSMVPAVKNPYGDTHGPFTVEKSTTACDANLLGFVTDPAKGAEGPKLNDHYLPMAIYGFFPAKVTLENGRIKRGDPITSSSKAGFGMKATNACKIIGYALEDADEEGKIQVFANLGEHSAPVVAELQSQIEKLRKEKSTEVEALKARLAALEQIVLSAEKIKK